MFTGLIQHRGKLLKKTAAAIAIDVGSLAKKLKISSSIAVDGVCLTVTAIRGSELTTDVMPETFKKTTLGLRKPGAPLNLELPLPKTGCFEGHIVTGHVERIGRVTKIQTRGNSRLFTVQIPSSLARYVVAKGSIALNGVSLTVIDVQKNLVTVGLIPHTLNHTNFATLKIGDNVNVETDIMAKYFEKWAKQ